MLAEYLAGGLEDFGAAKLGYDLLFGLQDYTNEFSVLNRMVAFRLPIDLPADAGEMTPLIGEMGDGSGPA
jgi:hypothetical protein